MASTSDSKGQEKIEKNAPWIEKYRPKLFNEIVGNQGKECFFLFFAPERFGQIFEKDVLMLHSESITLSYRNCVALGCVCKARKCAEYHHCWSAWYETMQNLPKPNILFINN